MDTGEVLLEEVADAGGSAGPADPHDEYTSVGRLPKVDPSAMHFAEDAQPQPCKARLCLLFMLLLVVPVFVALVLALVPMLLFQLAGLCLGRAPAPLHASEPRRPSAKKDGTATITLRDGRQLEYCVIGPKTGTPTVFVHGYVCSAVMFATEYFEAIFQAHNLCVYSVSVPGFGLSDSAPSFRGWGCWRTRRATGRPLADFALDIAELADQVIDPAHADAEAPPLVPQAEDKSGAAAGHVRFWVCGFSMGAAHAAAIAAGLPERILGVGLFGPTDPLAGSAADYSCCCCAGRVHERWQGGPCFSMIRLASCCRPIILTPALDSLARLIVWMFLGNGHVEKRLGQLGFPRTKGGLALGRLFAARGKPPSFAALDHAVCHSSLGWAYNLRVICSDWGFELPAIAKCGGRVLVATAVDDVVCAPQIARYVAREIPGAVLHESRQGWNHAFILLETDKLLRMLLEDGRGLDLPDGSQPWRVTVAPPQEAVAGEDAGAGKGEDGLGKAEATAAP